MKGLQVEDLSRGGLGVAREERRVVFVPLSMPGDVVSVRIVSEEKRFAEAELVAIERPSPDRVAPPCAVFGTCGGCSWQHVPYAMQWKTKRDGALHALSRTGVALPAGAIEEFPAERAWHYRNRIQMRARLVGGELVMGFFARRSRDLVDVLRCEITREEVNLALPGVRAEAKSQLERRTGSGESDPQLKVEIEVLPDGTVRTAWNARHGALGFRQVNDEQNERLRAYVRAQLSEGSHLLDLFGGAGNFSFDDAARYAWVECVDTGSPEGGFDSQPANYRFFRSDVGRWLQRRGKDLASAHFSPKGPIEAVLDPPREGLGDQSNKIAGALEALGARKIVAVGCDPDSWARDLARLLKRGWVLERIGLFDLFPQTPHVEAVGVLARRPSS